MITEKVGSYLLWIQGFRDARVIDSEKALHDLRGSFDGIQLQLLRADRIAGIEHMVFAARNAVDSFTSKDRRAKHLSMEFLLFASGEHQIVEAIKLLGVSASNTDLALVGLSEDSTDPSTLIDRATDVVQGIFDDYVLEVASPKKQAELKKAYNMPGKPLTAAKTSGKTERAGRTGLAIASSALC